MPAVSADVDGRIAINELMARNVLTTQDEAGHAGGWIELFNPTDQDIPLQGYGITDDLGAPRKAVFATGVVLRAHEHLLFWLDGNAAAGGSHIPLSLAKAGGTVGIARPDGSFIDRVAYGAQEVDFSAAREPDGSDHWVIEWHVSPGAANPAGAGQARGLANAADPPETIPAAGDLSERILGYDVIPELALTIEPAQWASLQTAPDTYVTATLTFDGRAYGPIGVHLKGMQSFEPIDQKPSLHVNIDKFVADAAFFGLSDLTLNNMHSDASMMHERIAYWVARTAGAFPASRANHAMLTVNGQLYGLYTNVETVKKHLLGRWFTDASGPLFSATDVDFITPDVPLYDLVSGPDDRTLLAGVASAMTLPNPGDAINAAAAYVNLDQLTRFWAMCAVVAQFDSFPYSVPGDDYFTYADPATHRLWFMPWGMDETFLSSDLNILTLMTAPLAHTCLASASCKQKIVTAVWDILGKVESGSGWVAEHDRVAAQIAPYIARDTRRHHTDAQIAMGQMDMWFFLSSRRTWISSMIPAAAP